MGSLDDNDSLDFSDGWDESAVGVVDRLFGTDPLSRWEEAQAVYLESGANVQFLLVEGVGHDRKALQDFAVDFFKTLAE